MAREKQIQGKSTKIATPTSGIDGIHHAVRALYGYKKPAFYKELAQAANITRIYMSASLSSARDIGLAELAGKRGLYKLTTEGQEYGRLLTYGQEAKCREILKGILLENPLWTEIIAFLRVAKGQARDPIDLVSMVEGKLGKRWSQSMRTRVAGNYASILHYAGLVKLEEGKMISQIGVEVAMEPEEVEEKGEPKRAEELVSTRKPVTTISPKEFAELRVPDSFILYVRKDLDAIEYFEQQVKEGSIFASWIQFLKTKIEKEKA